MLKSERMSHIIIAAPKSFLDKTINELYKLNAVHIVDHSKKDLDIAAPLKSASTISEVLVKVRALIANFNFTESVSLNNGFRAIGVKNFAQLSKTIKTLQSEINTQLEKLKQIDDEIKIIDKKKNLLTRLHNLDLPIESYGEYASLSVFTGYVNDAELVKKDVSKLTNEYEMHSETAGSSSLIALFVVKEKSEQVSDILAKHNFSELDLSLLKGIKGIPSSELIATFMSKHEKLSKEKILAQNQFRNLGEKQHDFLLLSERFLSIELEKAEIPLRFAASENVFVVTGWIPSKNAEIVTKRMESVTKGNLEIRIDKPNHEQNVPVKLANNKLAKPFEFLMNLYALPKYNEIDPTIFIFLTFPLFFGIILGDIGYGITVALLLMFISKKIPEAAPLTKVIMPAAMSSIFFGFLFGEVFGFEVLFGYHLPHLISRIHEINTMLALSIIVGVIHINMGFLLGFLNELSHEGLKKAVLAKGSWWVLQAGVVLAVLSIMGIVAVPLYVSGLIAILAIMMLIFGEPQAIIELPGLASNILSYSRLMAVGLASVSLAVVVNGFVEQFASAGGIMIFIAIFVGILGHSLNIALGLLGGFLHSIRLNYVEFFTKFFKGGATPFIPFGKTREAAES